MYFFPYTACSASYQLYRSDDLQMGGAKGVEESEVTTLVTGTANGMFMHIHKRKQRSSSG